MHMNRNTNDSNKKRAAAIRDESHQIGMHYPYSVPLFRQFRIKASKLTQWSESMNGYGFPYTATIEIEGLYTLYSHSQANNYAIKPPLGSVHLLLLSVAEMWRFHDSINFSGLVFVAVEKMWQNEWPIHTCLSKYTRLWIYIQQWYGYNTEHNLSISFFFHHD